MRLFQFMRVLVPAICRDATLLPRSGHLRPDFGLTNNLPVARISWLGSPDRMLQGIEDHEV